VSAREDDLRDVGTRLSLWGGVRRSVAMVCRMRMVAGLVGDVRWIELQGGGLSPVSMRIRISRCRDARWKGAVKRVDVGWRAASTLHAGSGP
jgi:hypothetical protein